MKTTLKKLSIPKPKGGFDELYLDEFISKDRLRDEISALKKLVYKLHFEKDEVTDIHPFYIKSLEDDNVVYDSTLTCRLSTHTSDVEYSYDGEWYNLSDVETISLNKGERVYFRYVGENYLSGVAENVAQSRLTTTTKTFDVGGDIRTLMFGNTTEESIPESGMESLFNGLKVVDASKLLLKATTLSKSCYHSMFKGCTGLTQAPELPATTLMGGCYGSMFYGCESLTQAPVLPAKTLADMCYQSMFMDCKSLTVAPELPATTLADYCYLQMFFGCDSLIQAPVLPAKTLADACYFCMFNGCDSLIQAPELPATTLAVQCYYGMFSYCTGLTQAPELPATTLTENCYNCMFIGCSNLNYIKCLATDISASNCTNGWVSGVASTGTFVKNAGTTWTTGTNGIPSGWNIEAYNALTFTAEEANSTIGFVNLVTSWQTLEYCTDAIGWTSMDASTIVKLENVGDRVYMRGNMGNLLGDFSLCTRFKMTGKIAASGSCNWLWNKNDGYGNLNHDCCGYYLFKDCTSLTQAPELPATKLAIYCYTGMFSGCTGLTQVPEVLPATTLAERCYSSMFWGCTGLTQAPELPATTLADDCYYGMFNGCTALTQAPALPATTLADDCYSSMFDGCTALTQAPDLPATTLAKYCYKSMFYGCTGLTQAPVLPATTLADSCYYSMFEGCTALTNAPVLPATTLVSRCYSYMFYGCKGLTTAPELPASTLVSECYYSMFNGCSNLNYIKCLATYISASNCKTNWVNGVSSTGTFVKEVGVNWTTGTSGIPSGWTVEEPEVVTFTAEEANSTIGLTRLSTKQTLEYKTVNSGWTNMDSSTTITLSSVGDKVYMRGVLSGDNNDSNCTQFKISGKIAASGNCNALWNKDDLNAPLKAYCGYSMFFGCTGLTQAPVLPATTLSEACYSHMFNGCTGLTQAPELPATTLSEACYFCMFWGCTGLTQAPALPAITLAYSCYNSMFSACTGLTQAPELPATTLASYCYYSMFWGCTGLTQAPELPATKLEQNCYKNMFVSCSNLNYIKCLATNISAYSCTTDWVSGVSSTGTFIKSSGVNWTTGGSGIPSGWTVEEV